MKPPLGTVMDSSAGMGNSEDYRRELSPRGFCLLINRLEEPSMAPLSPEDRPLYERFGRIGCILGLFLAEHRARGAGLREPLRAAPQAAKCALAAKHTHGCPLRTCRPR